MLKNSSGDFLVCNNYETFTRLVFKTSNSTDLDRFYFSNIEKIVDDVNVSLIRVDQTNVDEYSNIWLEVIQSLKGVRNFNHAREIHREFKNYFLENSDDLIISDSIPIIRVLVVDGKTVGLLSGIISFFESGVFLQIGSFGISRKYRKKGYGKLFVDLLKEDMSYFSVNGIWLLPQNDLFWKKQDFVYETKLMHNLYNVRFHEQRMIYQMSDKKLEFIDFIKMFFDGDIEDMKYIRSERSFR